jgi:four helix bundle protein
VDDRVPIRSYKDLDVWQVAMELTEDCYHLTAAFPREEAFGLTAQIRRAAVSVPANIAEGYGRELTGSFIQFLRIAQGSVKELETHFHIGVRVNLATPEATAPLIEKCDRLSRMLRNLIRALERKADG